MGVLRSLERMTMGQVWVPLQGVDPSGSEAECQVAWGQMGGDVGLVPLPTLPPPLGLRLFLERPGFHSRSQLEPVFLGRLEASARVWIEVLCGGRQQERN